MCQTATEPIRKAIFEKKVAPKGEKPHFFNEQEGIQKMRKVICYQYVTISKYVIKSF